MGTPYLSEIRLVSFNFPPKGWAFCNGQLLPINQNQALFALMGTTYGGDGRVNFALPNLQGRTPLHFGNGFTLGQNGGAESHTLTIQEMPAHTHPLMAASGTAASTNVPIANPPNDLTTKVLANTAAPMYASPGSGQNNVLMDPSTISNVGGSQPHTNMQPYLVLNFIIALQGIFPSQN